MCLHGRRADGRIVPLDPYAGLVIPLTLEQIRRLLHAKAEAKIHLASKCGNVGFCTDISGRTASEEGSHRRNIEELSGELTLTREGLRMLFEVTLGDYLPETVYGSHPSEPGRKTLHLDYVVPWESLFLAGLGFAYQREQGLIK
jgi:hypothetical protein